MTHRQTSEERVVSDYGHRHQTYSNRLTYELGYLKRCEGFLDGCYDRKV